ncbi:MAG: nudH, partial [Sphingomonas bacterium]|uniref:hypothetical protein n=1 Tax=Sphingomonas bacterium TaxID=1895847 RepID=UPI002611ED3D
KRDVYQMALTELARFLPRGSQHNRYLRAGMRPHHRDDVGERAGPSEREPEAAEAVTPPTAASTQSAEPRL